MDFVNAAVEALKALIDTTKTDLVSIAVNKHHLAITLIPKPGVGPVRLKALLKRTGIYPKLYRQIGCRSGTVMTIITRASRPILMGAVSGFLSGFIQR